MNFQSPTKNYYVVNPQNQQQAQQIIYQSPPMPKTQLKNQGIIQSPIVTNISTEHDMNSAYTLKNSNHDHKKVGELEHQIQILQTKNDNLEDLLLKYQGNLEEQQSEIRQNQELKFSFNQCQQQLQERTQELQSYRALNDSKDSAIKNVRYYEIEIQKYHRSSMEKDQEILDLNNQIKEMKSSMTQDFPTQEQYELKVKKLECHMNQLKSDHQSQIQNQSLIFEEKIGLMGSESKEFKDIIETKSTFIQDFQNKIEEYKQKNENLQSQLYRSEESKALVLKELKQQQNYSNEKLSEKESLKVLVQQNEIKLIEFQELQKEYEKNKEQLKTQYQSLQRLSKLELEGQENKLKIENLDKQLQRQAKNHTQILDKKEVQIQEIKNQFQIEKLALKKQIEEYQVEVSNEKSKNNSLAQENSSYLLKIGTLQQKLTIEQGERNVILKQNLKHSEKIAQNNNTITKHEVEVLQKNQNIQQLELDNSQLQNKIEQLEDTIQNQQKSKIKTENTILDLEGQINEYMPYKEQYHKVLSASIEQNTNIEGYQRKIDQLSDDIQYLNVQNSNLKYQFDEKTHDISKLQVKQNIDLQKIRQLENDIKLVNSGIQGDQLMYSSELDRKNKEIGELQQKFEELLAQFGVADEEIGDKQEEINESKQKLKLLHGHLFQMVQNFSSLQQINMKQNTDISNLQQMYNSSQNQLQSTTDFNIKVSQQQNIIDQKNDEVNDLINTQEGFRKENTMLKQEIENKQLEFQDFYLKQNQLLQTSSDENQSLVEKNMQFCEEIKKTQVEIQNLKELLKGDQSEPDQLKFQQAIQQLAICQQIIETQCQQINSQQEVMKNLKQKILSSHVAQQQKQVLQDQRQFYSLQNSYPLDPISNQELSNCQFSESKSQDDKDMQYEYRSADNLEEKNQQEEGQVQQYIRLEENLMEEQTEENQTEQQENVE